MFGTTEACEQWFFKMKNKKTKIQFLLTDGHLKSFMTVIFGTNSPRKEIMPSVLPIYTVTEIRFGHFTDW